jgi:hypothetical protein
MGIPGSGLIEGELYIFCDESHVCPEIPDAAEIELKKPVPLAQYQSL